MSRHSPRDNSNAVSLFPFLAVLLCTMGALVVLLVAMAQAASRRAAIIAEAEAEPTAIAIAETDMPDNPSPAPEPETPPPAADSEAFDRLRAVEQREQQLAELQDKAAASLRDDETRLSHIEDHVRRLREQLIALKRAEAELAATETQYQDEQGQAERELERLQELIRETELDVQRHEEEQRGKQKSYAIVPYRGPNGTRRRPLYIECHRDRVVLQPQGVTLEAIDFRPPLGVGNPLSAALRAARKYDRQRGPEADYDPGSAPYPLIIVRPDGIKMFHRVRAALESGDSDFGYELVRQDWDLEFGSPNPELASRQRDAIDHARLRRQLLSRAAPSAYEGQGSAYAPVRSGPGRWGDGSGGTGGLSAGNGLPGGTRPPSAAAAAATTPRAYSAEDTLEYGQAGSPVPPTRAGSEAGGAGGAAVDPGRPNTSRGERYGALAEVGSRGNGDLAPPYGSARPTADARGGSSAAGAPAGRMNRAPGTPGAPTGESGQAASDSQQANGGAAGRPGGGGASGQRSLSVSFGQNNASGSGAGAGGGLGPARPQRGSLAIQRPIAVTVYSDRLIITPVDTNGQAIASRATTLPLTGRTDRHVGELEAAVGRQVASWGIAGRGFYWKPVLVFSVADGGQQRAGEFLSLLPTRGVAARYQQTANRGGAGAKR